MRVTVVKVGGAEVSDAASAAALAERIAGRGGRTVLVHGGGREVSDLQRALGSEPEWRDGLRITTEAGMRCVSMVLSGLVNKRLAAALVGAGADAVGISGEDAGLIRAVPLRGGALGRAGEPVEVRAALLRTLLDAGLLPVVSPVARGEDGGPLNVNADDAAAAVAAALGADELLLVSDVAGVLDGGAVVPELDGAGVEALAAAGTAAGGMLPKLRAALRAAEAGVRVRIGGREMLDDPAAGTRVRASAPAAATAGGRA